MKCIKAAFETADSNSTQFNMLEPLHKLQNIWPVVAKLKILILHLKMGVQIKHLHLGAIIS